MKSRLVSLVSFIFSILSLPALAVYHVGDTVGDIKWTDVNGAQIHLQDENIKSTVRVLLFNAGWCGPCNSEFEELVPAVSEFDEAPVTFISLSAEGWQRRAKPDQNFLREWKEKHSIPFTVAASPGDFGSKFTSQPYIPNVAIVDAEGKLAYAAVNPGAEAIAKQVRQLLDRAH